MEIDEIDFTIWISYEIHENINIPITYTVLKQFSYFDIERFKERLKYNKKNFNDIEYGFDSDEIETMDKLCKYLTNNEDIIKEITNIMNKK